MRRKPFRFYAGIFLSTVTSIFSHAAHGKAIETGGTKAIKKERERAAASASGHSVNYRSAGDASDPPPSPGEKYPWKKNIVTTTFWIGEEPTKNNPVPNQASSWDGQWAKNYGGYDNPKKRDGYLPAGFTPKQNPFYIALPYNDKTMQGHKAEAKKVIPWFEDAYQGPGKSVCKGRWIMIRHGDRVCYAQWEDAGPFRTDHWEYVFGNERPKPNLNKGAGLDVSPAVRDYLGMDGTDVCDWKFVDFEDVPTGPWALHGKNNPFVNNALRQDSQLAMN